MASGSNLGVLAAEVAEPPGLELLDLGVGSAHVGVACMGNTPFSHAEPCCLAHEAVELLNGKADKPSCWGAGGIGRRAPTTRFC